MNASDNSRGIFAKQELARTAAVSAKAKVATLERDRFAALHGDDEIDAVLAIDDEIARQRRIVNLCHDRLAALARPLSGPEQTALGLDTKYHPITGVAVEDGAGAWAPDRQARELHIPIIAKRDGDKAAAAVLAKLDKAASKAAA
jgi:hypothetical protein